MAFAARADMKAARALSKGLRGVDRQLDRTIKAELRKGTRPVVDKSRAKTVKKTGRAAASIKSTTVGLLPAVKGGGAAAPYFGWLEHGGGIPSARSPKRSNPMRGFQWRPLKRDGRYLTPTALDAADDMGEDTGDALRTLIDRAY